MQTDELMAAACPIIGTIGFSYYFHPETLAVGKEYGLDGLRWYVLGRGGVLGDVEAPVVTAAFGYFSPALISKMWDSSRSKLAPREAGRRYYLCAAEHGHRKLTGVEGLAEYCAAAEKVIAAADRDGLSLFAALAAEPLVEDLPGRSMQLTAVLREFRGSAHLAAVVASGLRARTAHFIKRPNDVKMFGYDESEAVVGPGDPDRLASAEAATNAIVSRAFSVLSPAEAQALADGAARLQAALA